VVLLPSYSPSMRLRAIVALTGACLFWGIGFPVMKALTIGAEEADPGVSSWFLSAYFIAARFLAAAVVIVVARPLLPSRGEAAQGAALGVITGIGMLLQLDGLQYTEASTNAFLTQGYVVFLPAGAMLVTKKPPPVRVVVCAFIVSIGLAVLARFDPRTLSIGRGEAETLAAAFCFMFQIALLDMRRFRDNRTFPVSTVMFTTMAVVMLPFVALTARGAGDLRIPFAAPASVWCFAVLVALPTLGSFLLMNRYQRLVSASEAGIIYATEPAFASVFALFVPGWLSLLSRISYADETLSSRLLWGGALVVSANVLLAVLQPEAKPPPEAVGRALDSEA
jgi:drug/metabolite transporter (DMT)-like permease